MWAWLRSSGVFDGSHSCVFLTMNNAKQTHINTFFCESGISVGETYLQAHMAFLLISMHWDYLLKGGVYLCFAALTSFSFPHSYLIMPKHKHCVKQLQQLILIKPGNNEGCGASWHPWSWKINTFIRGNQEPGNYMKWYVIIEPKEFI